MWRSEAQIPHMAPGSDLTRVHFCYQPLIPGSMSYKLEIQHIMTVIGLECIKHSVNYAPRNSCWIQMLALNTIITLEIRCDPINSLNCSFNLLFSDTFNSLINFTLYSLLLLFCPMSESPSGKREGFQNNATRKKREVYYWLESGLLPRVQHSGTGSESPEQRGLPKFIRYA